MPEGVRDGSWPRRSLYKAIAKVCESSRQGCMRAAGQTYGCSRCLFISGKLASFDRRQCDDQRGHSRSSSTSRSSAPSPNSLSNSSTSSGMCVVGAARRACDDEGAYMRSARAPPVG